MAKVKGALVALGQEKLALCQSMFDRAADTARSETADQFYQLLELHQKAQDKKYFEFSDEEISQLISVIYSFATCGTSVYLDNMTRGARGVGLEQVSSFIESQKNFIKFATCAKAALSGGLSRSPLVAGVQSSAMIASLIDYMTSESSKKETEIAKPASEETLSPEELEKKKRAEALLNLTGSIVARTITKFIPMASMLGLPPGSLKDSVVGVLNHATKNKLEKLISGALVSTLSELPTDKIPKSTQVAAAHEASPDGSGRSSTQAQREGASRSSSASHSLEAVVKSKPDLSEGRRAASDQRVRAEIEDKGYSSDSQGSTVVTRSKSSSRSAGDALVESAEGQPSTRSQSPSRSSTASRSDHESEEVAREDSSPSRGRSKSPSKSAGNTGVASEEDQSSVRSGSPSRSPATKGSDHQDEDVTREEVVREELSPSRVRSQSPSKSAENTAVESEEGQFSARSQSPSHSSAARSSGQEGEEVARGNVSLSRSTSAEVHEISGEGRVGRVSGSRGLRITGSASPKRGSPSQGQGGDEGNLEGEDGAGGEQPSTGYLGRLFGSAIISGGSPKIKPGLYRPGFTAAAGGYGYSGLMLRGLGPGYKPQSVSVDALSKKKSSLPTHQQDHVDQFVQEVRERFSHSDFEVIKFKGNVMLKSKRDNVMIQIKERKSYFEPGSNPEHSIEVDPEVLKTLHQVMEVKH